MSKSKFAFNLLLTGLIFSIGTAQAKEPARGIDFNRDIRSILSNQCYACHGPDDNEVQGGLRLDQSTATRVELDSGAIAIVPGKPGQSELVARITSDDADLRMPPSDSAKQLTSREIELLTQWVREGGEYAQHWSYVKPVRPVLPPLSDLSWTKNTIDYFVLARLMREDLKPSTEADRHAIIRRLSLDLTGLPPTIEEVDHFVSDTDPKAYGNLVDRLLKKETYGEHWGADVARLGALR